MWVGLGEEGKGRQVETCKKVCTAWQRGTQGPETADCSMMGGCCRCIATLEA